MPIPKQVMILLVLLCASSVLGSFFWSFMFCFYLAVTEATIFSIQANDLFAVVYVGIVSSVVAIPTALVFGIPMFFVLRSSRLLSWWSLLIAGGASGAVIGTASFSFGVLWSAGLGLVSACIAWLLIVRSNLPLNPDAPPIGGAPGS